MTNGSVTPKPRRAKGSFTAGEVTRALIASAAIGVILWQAVFVTTGSYFSAEQQTKNAIAKSLAFSPSLRGAADHRVASAVRETDRKGLCQERRLYQLSARIAASHSVTREAR